MISVKKIGFACKYMHPDRTINTSELKQIESQYNSSSTTIAWLSRQTRDNAENALMQYSIQNAIKTYKLVECVSNLPENLKMVRLSSDQCPAYTHNDWKNFYKQDDVITELMSLWRKTGDLAREKNVRLSFHPGQFCCLASDRPDVIVNSLAEIEYHADMARWMGYGSDFHDHGFKINIHISGRGGIEQFKRSLAMLSPVARNLITVENEEMTYGLDDCIAVSDVVPIVLDIHHHWVREGNYIDRRDDRVSRVIDSWRGIRPTLHYSVSRRELLADHCSSTRPDHTLLLESGKNKQKLRAHSDFYWNTGLNDWALEFLENFDIQCEAKGKNIASAELYKRAKELSIL